VNKAAHPEAPARGCDTRILCLGNELLADDSLGHVVANYLRSCLIAETEIVNTPEAGFHLLDYLLDTQRLLVIDSVLTGNAPVGAIHVLREEELNVITGGSPHYVGLRESLLLARALSLTVAEEVVIIAVEIADCTTLGRMMHPAVRRAIPEVIRIARDLLT
jgi:hydrogenase maturation protease